jgi:hypothetical protein
MQWVCECGHRCTTCHRWRKLPCDRCNRGMVRLPDFDEQLTVVTYGPAELVIATDAMTVPVEILPEGGQQ